MKWTLVLIVAVSLSACVSEPESMQLPLPEGLPAQPVPSPLAPLSHTTTEFHIIDLQNQLGLARSTEDLGFDEKSFDSCRYFIPESQSSCGQRYLSVVHFRLLCRDSVETVQTVSNNFTPLQTSQMQWRLAGVKGDTSTDSQGFGQVRVISPRTTKAQRFMLILGSRSLGVEASEVSQIVVPGDWCREMAGQGLPLVPNYVVSGN